MTLILQELPTQFVYPDCSDKQINELEELRSTYRPASEEEVQSDHLQLISKDIYLGYHRIHLNSDHVITLKRTTGVVQLLFVIEGCYTVGDRREEAVSEGEHNIFYLGDEPLKIAVKARTPMEFIDIQLHPSFIERYISAGHILHEMIRKEEKTRLIEPNMAIGPQIRSNLHDLLHCEFEGYLKNLYVRAKVIELFTLQLAQYDELLKTAQSGLKKADISKMNIVRAFITSSPEKNHTLADLARVAGTNEQYLKQHFKLVYGQTVFGYLNNYRMQMAKEMLLTSDKKVAEIALEVGYQHPTHFTKAFKKHFGYLPLHIRNSAKALIVGIGEILLEFEGIASSLMGV